MYVDVVGGEVLFCAAHGDLKLVKQQISQPDPALNRWIEIAAGESSINRLDDLAMNRHKLTLWGDSTFEHLRGRYEDLFSRLKHQPTRGPQIEAPVH